MTRYTMEHTILIGAPGCGKTRWAREQYSKRAIQYSESVDGHAYRLVGESDRTMRGFRAPHHSCAVIGITGALRMHRWLPGEASLAHGGILYLDEIPEFSRAAIESLREPLETGRICLSSGRNVLHVPAEFTLIGSAQPCPCGYLGHPDRVCTCSPGTVRRYQERIPGWLRQRCRVLDNFRYLGDRATWDGCDDDAGDAIGRPV